jgi:MinD-like ATPase involved in chromosome partitioning or flagellar assembly
MVGLVITIAQRKGGAGKTTLATQLAVAWARCGARVAALDIDPQGSFSAWADLRRTRLGPKAIGFDFAALPGWRAAQWVDDRVGSADLVVIDAPPHVETEARLAVRAARLVVVPVQPSPLDLWATAETLKMAQDDVDCAHEDAKEWGCIRRGAGRISAPSPLSRPAADMITMTVFITGARYGPMAIALPCYERKSSVIIFRRVR